MLTTGSGAHGTLFQMIHESTLPNHRKMQTLESYFFFYGEEQFVANDTVEKSELCPCKFPENMSKNCAGQKTN